MSNIPKHITIKDIGGIYVIGKAATLSRQLAHIASLYSVARKP